MLGLYALALAFVFTFLSTKAASAAPIELRSGTANICGVDMRKDTRDKCPGETVWIFDEDGELRLKKAPKKISSDVHCDHVVDLQWIRNKIQGNSITKDLCDRAAKAVSDNSPVSEALETFQTELEKKINGASNLVFVDWRVNIGKSPHVGNNPDYDPLKRIPTDAAQRCTRRQTQKGCATYLAAVEAPAKLTVETVQSIFANAQTIVNPKAPPLTLTWTNDLAGAIRKAQANIARYLCDERTQRRRAIDYTVEFYLGPILDRRGGQPMIEEKCDPTATSVPSTKRPSPSSVRPSIPLGHPISTAPHASMATSSQRLSSALVAGETPRLDRPPISTATARPTNVAPSTHTLIPQRSSSKIVQSLRPSSTVRPVAGSQSQPQIQRIAAASSLGAVPSQRPPSIATALPETGPHSAPAVLQQQQQGSQQLHPSSVPHGLPAASAPASAPMATRPVASASAPGYASRPKRPAQSTPKANPGRASPRSGRTV